jgi:nucleoside phosphorylase
MRQVIQETGCSHIISVGTCGGIRGEHDLGDVLVTRAAKFRCAQEFEDAAFNQKIYKSKWNVPTTQFAMAEKLMRPFAKNLNEPIFGPPTKRHHGDTWLLTKAFIPNIIHESGEADCRLPEFHPILTTDYFEFGHSRNAEELWAEGCGVEMGDAVLGLVCEEDLADPPKWLVIRNLSDPQINGDITSAPRSLDMRIHWAVWYYETYGYWTSVMSSIAAWAVIAGLQNDT